MITLKKGSKGEPVKSLQIKLNLYPDGIFGAITEEAVKSFQKSKGLIADGVVGQSTWNALGYNPNKRTINEIIVHCTASPEGRDLTVQQIRDLHIKSNGWSDIGYHYVIYRDGSIHQGRAENTIGAHCTGHNSNSIGVCYVGGITTTNTPKDTRTQAQKESLIRLLKELKNKYPGAKIYGHRDFANKACPSFDATSEYRNL